MVVVDSNKGSRVGGLRMELIRNGLKGLTQNERRVREKKAVEIVWGGQILRLSHPEPDSKASETNGQQYVSVKTTSKQRKKKKKKTKTEEEKQE